MQCDEKYHQAGIALDQVKLETKPKTYIVGKGCSELAFAAAASKSGDDNPISTFALPVHHRLEHQDGPCTLFQLATIYGNGAGA